MSEKIKICIVGVGNCASGFVQGIEYYKQHPERQVVGIMHEDIGGYNVRDIEVACAFDVDKEKVGKTFDLACTSGPNMVDWIKLPKSNVIVRQGPLYDGIGKYLKGMVEPVAERPVEELEKEILAELKNSGAQIIVNYLPVGSQKAVEFWANIAIKSRCAFINAMPVFIASDRKWAEKFQKAGVPIIGDDMKGMLGATIVHRVLAKLTVDRGAELSNTYQLNVGGNTDFINMLERERLVSKKISKTESVQSQLEVPLDSGHIHIGPSDYVKFLGNTKIAFMRLRGKMWADIPYDIEVKLEVDDKANAGGIIADAVRIAKVALERKVGGALVGPSAYLMKHPPLQMPDSDAKVELEKFFS